MTKSSSQERPPPSTGYDVIREAPERLTEVPSQSSEKYARARSTHGPYHAVEFNNINNHHQDNDWSTGIMSCSLDGDSCWWSSWCCCLVSARNAATFNLGSSIVEVRNVILFLGVSHLVIDLLMDEHHLHLLLLPLRQLLHYVTPCSWYKLW